MIKYFKPGEFDKEVKAGDKLHIAKARDGQIIFSIIQIGDQKDLEALHKKGLLVKVIYTDKPAKLEADQSPKPEPPKDVSFYVELLAASMNWKPQKMARYLETLLKLYPITVFNLLSRAIAEYLDQSYPDHISKAKEIWVISTINGTPMQAPKGQLTDFRNFSAFRSKEDADFACEVLKDLWENLYGGK